MTLFIKFVKCQLVLKMCCVPKKEKNRESWTLQIIYFFSFICQKVTDLKMFLGYLQNSEIANQPVKGVVCLLWKIEFWNGRGYFRPRSKKSRWFFFPQKSVCDSRFEHFWGLDWHDPLLAELPAQEKSVCLRKYIYPLDSLEKQVKGTR